MKQKLIETRGRKRLKVYKLKVGELAEFEQSELNNIKYAAGKAGWTISVRNINKKLMVFRSC